MPVTLVCSTCHRKEPAGPEGDAVFLALGPEIAPGHFSVREDPELSAFDAARIAFWALNFANGQIETLAAECEDLGRRLAAYEAVSEDTFGGHGPFVASRFRPHFHRPDCDYAAHFINSRRCEVFDTHEQAVESGKKPCKTCRA